MHYADNQPCKECAACIERAEAERCRNCEARTLQLFIRWMAAAILALATSVFFLALHAR